MAEYIKINSDSCHKVITGLTLKTLRTEGADVLRPYVMGEYMGDAKERNQYAFPIILMYCCLYYIVAINESSAPDYVVRLTAIGNINKGLHQLIQEGKLEPIFTENGIKFVAIQRNVNPLKEVYYIPRELAMHLEELSNSIVNDEITFAQLKLLDTLFEFVNPLDKNGKGVDIETAVRNLALSKEDKKELLIAGFKKPL